MSPFTDYSVSAALGRALVSFAVSRGAHRRTLMQRAGVRASELDGEHGRVPLDAYQRLFTVAKELCADAAFALHFGDAFDIVEVSIVGLIGQHAASVDEAFEVLSRYDRLDVDVPLAGSRRFEIERGSEGIWLVDMRAQPNDFPELTESGFARMCRTAHRIFGDARFVRAIQVTHAAPDYRAEYGRVFGVDVNFECTRNAMLIDPACLTFATGLSSPHWKPLLVNQADALVDQADKGKTMRKRVEDTLIARLPDGDVVMDRVARSLALSRASLFRRLRAEGVSYAQVLDELRCALAARYLDQENVSVNETARRLGYSDAAAFSRAFKRWTGSAPSSRRG